MTRWTSSSSSPKGDVGLTGVPSGFPDLDDLTGGFQNGNLVVLAARPAMGKSALATNFAENAAVDHGKSVALFSLEMSETELAHRFLASRARVSSDELRKGRVKAERWNKVNQAAGKLAGAPLYIDDSSDLGILELRAKAAAPRGPPRPRNGDRRLPPAHAPRGTLRQPRRADRPDQPRPEDPRARARRARGSDLTALPGGGIAQSARADAVGPS